MAEGSCARPTGASVTGQKQETQDLPTHVNDKQEDTVVRAQVGKPAPDFNAPTYYKGEFSEIKLSDHLGKWTLLCFYPGDFTYV